MLSIKENFGIFILFLNSYSVGVSITEGIKWIRL